MQSETQMKTFVINLLKEKLPSSYYYHNEKHTLYVMEKTIEIARHENRTEKEIQLLSAAALWHDVGLIHIYDGHEEEGCKLATPVLAENGFSKEEIKIICGMIMATKLPQSPQNKLEEIIADADLEYLGTEKAAGLAERLFREFQSLNPSLTREEWNRTQISFIKDHKYFTPFCRQNREPVKTAYLEALQNNI